jgi:4-amino-4-deoxy-L-arabinose transferase-like glycosyltransferase
VQPLLILFGALFTVAVCLACGGLLLRDAAVDIGVRFVVGAAVLSLVVFAIAAVGVVYPAVFLVMGAAVLCFARRDIFRSRDRKGAVGPRSLTLAALSLLFAVWFAIYFVHAMAPEVSPDGSAYHLALVARYLREHGFHRITTNLYASLSQGIEMLFLFAFAFGRHSAAALVHFAFLLALVWQMFVYARREGFPLAGGCAAFLVFASPVVGIDGASAYNDVAVAAIAFTIFNLLQIWEGNRETRLLIAIGMLAGFAYATKYTAVLAVPYAAGYVAWKSRRWRDVLIVGGCAMLLILPWMIKNWIWVENPTAPFFNQWFPNPYVSTSFEAEYKDYLTHYELTSLRQIPMQVTTYGALSGLLGPVFLLAPIALLAALRKEGRQLLLAALVFGVTYFSNIGARFLIPPLPFIALAMTLPFARVFARFPAVPFALVAVHAVLSWPSIVPKYGRQDAWRLRGMPWREALRIRPEASWLERWIPDYGAVRLIEMATPPGSTIFSTQPLPEAYTSRRILVEYYSTENQVSGRMLRSGAVPGYAPTLRMHFPFARQPLRAIRVVQTAAPAGAGGNLWSMNELRVFDGGRELPRLARWRLRARPYAWGIQNAFDNSLITFWISGDSLRAGMYVEADFGGSEEADSVDIQCAPNQWQVRLKLEGIPVSASAGAGWKTLAESPVQIEEARPIGWRRAVADELKRRGIDYVMLFDSDLGADDLRRNPDRWGIMPIGKSKASRLYKLP